MPSRAESVRRMVEHVLRGLALAGLVALLSRAMFPPKAGGTDVARGDLTAALARWTRTASADMHVVLDAAPDPPTRDWLRALSRTGGRVHWSSPRTLSPAAVVAEPAPEPNGATRVRLAAATGEPVSIVDAAGLVDTLPRGGPAELELASVAGDVRARGATFTAATRARDSVVLRPVLVVGAAGWESKFTIAALEERGWRVASRVRVAPKVDVTQGPLGTLDTARYSAVIVLDSTAGVQGSDLSRYARTGGGVILAGSAARIAGVSPIAPGGVGRRLAGVAGGVATVNPRTGLAAYAVTAPQAEAVPLEARDGSIVVAARRVESGRVMQSGYDETWRWRMSGGDDAAAAHREWWSRLVAAVAYTPLVSRLGGDDTSIDEAPLASLVDALGNASPFDARLAAHDDGRLLTRVLFGVVVASLLLEWASRRLRGAR